CVEVARSVAPGGERVLVGHGAVRLVVDDELEACDIGVTTGVAHDQRALPTRAYQHHVEVVGERVLQAVQGHVDVSDGAGPGDLRRRGVRLSSVGRRQVQGPAGDEADVPGRVVQG